MSALYPNVAFSGAYTALITPFANGGVDKDAYVKLIEWQIAQGIHGLVPAGTTGESPTLSHEEHDLIVELCVKTAAGRVPVIAGAGSNNTAEAVRLSQHAEAVGADAVLIVSPYYNKPTQDGLYAHFSTIAKAISIPVIIYDIPGRSIVRVNDDTMARLAEIPNIVGVKDAIGDAARPTRLWNMIGDNFAQLSGDDATSLPYLTGGGHGCISVVSNIAPAAMAQMQDAFAKGNVKEAMAINKKLMALHDGLFCEASPGPVKYAASLLGICSADARMPIVEISDASKKIVEDALETAGLTS
ncbi:MAG: 4-hydroxy-tetrahydrodipicolinate synthase [Candidatus Puniceispirillaceae bacterium]